MEKVYKFIRIYQKSYEDDKPGTYVVLNKKSGYVLGTIQWYGPWRQYVFEPHDAIFSVDCMEDIVGFMKGLG